MGYSWTYYHTLRCHQKWLAGNIIELNGRSSIATFGYQRVYHGNICESSQFPIFHGYCMILLSLHTQPAIGQCFLNPRSFPSWIVIIHKVLDSMTPFFIINPCRAFEHCSCDIYGHTYIFILYMEKKHL